MSGYVYCMIERKFDFSSRNQKQDNSFSIKIIEEMNLPDKKQVTCLPTRKAPGFSYYFALVFVTGLFFIFLDFNYRSSGFLMHVKFGEFIKNLVFFVVFVSLCTAAIALIFWVMEAAFTWMVQKVLPFSKIAPGEKKRKIEADGTGKGGIFLKYVPGSFSTFLSYLLFIYVNLIYFKFYVASFTLDVKKALLPTGVLLFIALVLYFTVLRKKLHPQNLRKFTKNVSRFTACFTGICLVAAIIIFSLDARVAKKERSKEKELEKPNIVLITCDSLCAKNMSAYGYHRETTPNIDEFAQKSYLFKRAKTNSNYTTYALSSILGQYPRRKKTLSLTTVLKNNGYKKRIFLSFYGVDRYFQTDFTRCLVLRRFENTRLFKILSPGKNRWNLQWLSAVLSEDQQFVNLFVMWDLRDWDYTRPGAHPLPLFFDFVVDQLNSADSPVFIWAHIYEPHFPYNVPPRFRNRFGITLMDRYDSCILYMDEQFGKFIDRMKNEGHYDNSVIIFSSDHGESFGQEHAGWRGFFHSGHWLNERVTHIPLIIHTPGQKKGASPETFAELVDLAPTILDLVDVPIPQWMEGESLVRYMHNPDLLSKKLKICVPLSHFQRSYMNLEKKPKYWAVKNEDMFNACWYKYKIGWFQIYAPNPKNPKLVNRLERFQYYCIFNLFEDPDQTENLLNEDKFESLLDGIYNSPLVKYYRLREGE